LVSCNARFDSFGHSDNQTVVRLLGNQSIKAEKTKVYDGHLIGIGWHFDFIKWTVRPKDMAMRRLFIFGG